jgi:major membrane immunogen (membrane-anchored lipoprotein)
MKTTITVFILAIAALLTGCSSKPPACGDEKSITAIQNLLINEIQKNVQQNAAYKSDPTPAPAFFKTLKFVVSTITSDGYDEKAKRFSCHAKLDTSFLDREGHADINYSTQSTEDKKDDFLIKIEEGQRLINEVSRFAIDYVDQRRLAGNWRGSYSCNGLDGETTGAKAGFSQAVTLEVQDYAKGKLERVTAAGGVEKMDGQFDADNKLVLHGVGRNSPDDQWRVYFKGSVTDGKFAATGQLTDETGQRVFRTCQLQLTRNADGASVAK